MMPPSGMEIATVIVLSCPMASGQYSSAANTEIPNDTISTASSAQRMRLLWLNDDVISTRENVGAKHALCSLTSCARGTSRYSIFRIGSPFDNCLCKPRPQYWPRAVLVARSCLTASRVAAPCSTRCWSASIAFLNAGKLICLRWTLFASNTPNSAVRARTLFI